MKRLATLLAALGCVVCVVELRPLRSPNRRAHSVCTSAYGEVALFVRNLNITTTANELRDAH